VCRWTWDDHLEVYDPRSGAPLRLVSVIALTDLAPHPDGCVLLDETGAVRFLGADADRTLGLDYASDLVDSFSTRDLSWKILFGDTYLLSAGSPPLAIAVRDDEIQPTPTLAAPDYIARAIPLLIGALFAGAVALVLNQLRVWRARRKQEEDARAAMRLSMAHIADQLEIERDETTQ